MERKLISRVSLLYVEDDADVLESMIKYLSRRFDTVYQAGDGAEGLVLFERHRPDIVITDIQMPVMGGIEMARRIRKISPDTPIIITTAYTEIPYLIDAIEIGVDGYVAKPVVCANLFEMISKSALKFIHRQVIGAKNNLIQTLMDWQPTFSILISGENLDYVNRAFLGFMGYQTMEEFLKNHECIADFIVGIDAAGISSDGHQVSERWFRQIIDNPEVDHILLLQPKSESLAEPYRVKFRCFEAIDQFLFAFIAQEAIGKRATAVQSE